MSHDLILLLLTTLGAVELSRSVSNTCLRSVLIIPSHVILKPPLISSILSPLSS